MATGIADVVILLPGIGGSELMRGSRPIWGWSGAALLRNMLMSGPALREDLRIDADSPTEPVLDDGVHASRLLPDLHLLPGLWKIDGYCHLQRHLQSVLGLEVGRNFFPFPYDWRRDNRAAAHRLRKLSTEALARWRVTSGNPQARLILIAHSMGGLIARYFVEVLEGWRDTRALFSIGTPHEGATDVVTTLVNGVEPYGVELTDILRRMPSLYQLLPTYPCVQGSDGTCRSLADVQLPGLDRSQVLAGAAFHKEIAEAAVHNRQLPEYLSSAYRSIAIAGRDQPTNEAVRIVGRKLEISSDVPSRGDGIVSSASAGSHSSVVTLVPARHAVLHHDPVVLSSLSDSIAALCKVGQPPDRSGTAGQSPGISLDCEDICWSNAPLQIRAKCEKACWPLTADIADCSTGRQMRRATLRASEGGWHLARFPPMHPGYYRVTVRGHGGGSSAVSDVFEVTSHELMHSATAWSMGGKA